MTVYTSPKGRLECRACTSSDFDIYIGIDSGRLGDVDTICVITCNDCQMPHAKRYGQDIIALLLELEVDGGDRE